MSAEDDRTVIETGRVILSGGNEHHETCSKGQFGYHSNSHVFVTVMPVLKDGQLVVLNRQDWIITTLYLVVPSIKHTFKVC